MAASTSWSTMSAVVGVARALPTAAMTTAWCLGTQPDPDRADDAAGVAAHEGSAGCRGDQCRIDLWLVAATRDVGPVRRGEGGADLRHRAVGAGVRALWRPGQHGLAGLDSGRRQRMGSLPPRQPRVFRGLHPSRFSDGPPRHRRGGGGCDRIHRLAARPLDQRSKYPGGWSGAAARAARPPPVLRKKTPQRKGREEYAKVAKVPSPFAVFAHPL